MGRKINAFFDGLGRIAKQNMTPDLRARVVSGAVYFLVSAVCVLLSKWTTLLLMMVTAGISAAEFYAMLRSDAKLPNEMVGIVAAVLYPAGVFFLDWDGALFVAMLLLVALLVWYVFYLRARISDVAVSFFGASYTGLLLCGIIMIRCRVPDFWGGVLVLLVLLSTWANDAFAYLIGSKFGKHKLAPKISPKKSWEGFIAGLVASVAIWCVITLVPGVDLDVPMAMLAGLTCGVMGVLGDLAESRMKRNSGVKDSGTIMPGHGGLLDRTDSLFLVSVTAAIFLVGMHCI